MNIPFLSWLFKSDVTYVEPLHLREVKGVNGDLNNYHVRLSDANGKTLNFSGQRDLWFDVNGDKVTGELNHALNELFRGYCINNRRINESGEVWQKISEATR